MTDIKFCPYCGTELPITAAFCGGCGERVAESQVQPAGSPASAGRRDEAGSVPSDSTNNGSVDPFEDDRTAAEQIPLPGASTNVGSSALGPMPSSTTQPAAGDATSQEQPPNGSARRQATRREHHPTADRGVSQSAQSRAATTGASDATAPHASRRGTWLILSGAAVLVLALAVAWWYFDSSADGQIVTAPGTNTLAVQTLLPTDEPDEVWSEELDGRGDVVIVGNVLATLHHEVDDSGVDAVVTGWDLTTGDELWDLDERGYHRLSRTTDSVLVTSSASDDGVSGAFMASVDAATGEQRWAISEDGTGMSIRHTTGDWVTAIALEVYEGTAGQVMRIDMRTGEIAWDEDSDQLIDADADHVIVRDDDEVLLLDASTGDEILATEIASPVDDFGWWQGHATLSPNGLVITDDETATAYDLQGDELWDVDGARHVTHRPGVGLVLVGIDDDLAVLDATTGEELWDDNDTWNQVARHPDGQTWGIDSEWQDDGTYEVSFFDATDGHRIDRVDTEQGLASPSGRLLGSSGHVQDLVLVDDNDELRAVHMNDDLDEAWALDLEGTFEEWTATDRTLAVVTMDPDATTLESTVTVYR